MAANISSKITLDGEREYKQTISEINAALGVLNSEMEKTTAEFENNGDTIEELTKKGDILERKLLTQKEKVEELQKALENSIDKYSEASTKTMYWQKKLNEAETAVYKTEEAIEENNQALEDAQQPTEKLNGLLSQLAESLGDKLPAGAKDALESINGFSVAGVAAVAAVTVAIKELIDVEDKLIEMTREAAEHADEVLTMSQITGLDTDTIQELQYASELIDVSFETIQSSLEELTQKMADAASGTGDINEVFKDLGVSVTDSVDGSLRNAEDVFYELIDSLGKMSNETERDAKAMEIFGKSAQSLNPIIKDGSKALKEYGEEAKNVGYVLSKEQLEALGDVDDAYQKLKKTQESVKLQISSEMAPAVERFYKSWTEFMKKAGDALVESGVIDNLGVILDNFSALIDSFQNAEGEIPALKDALEGLSKALEGLAQFAAVVADMISMFKSLASLDLKGVANSLGFGYGSGNANNYQRTVMQQNGTWEQYSDFYSGSYNAPGDMNFVGGSTIVGENGPELVCLPQGSQIYNNQDTREMGGDVFNITIPADTIEEFNDIIEIVHEARVTARMG